MHKLYMEGDGRLVPVAGRRKEERLKNFSTALPEDGVVVNRGCAGPAPTPAPESALATAPASRGRTPSVSLFESEHKPLGENGRRAYVPGHEAWKAGGFGERAHDPRWSLNMMRARVELIRRNEEMQVKRGEIRRRISGGER
jgi:hypothetical protein